MARINRQGAFDVSRIWAETSAAISDMQMSGWQKFELSNHYETFYRNPAGEFLMSSDPNFNAAEHFPFETWTKLENVPR